MSKFEGYSRFLPWLLALMLSALVAGCGGGGGGQDPILGGGGMVGPVGSAKAISAFSLAGVTGTIDEAAKTIALTVPNGTNVTAQIATFTSTGAGVKVGAVAQASGTTPNDFTAPVAYIVTATDGSTATYAVTVTVSSVTAKAITAFSLAGIAGTIDEAAKTIAVNVPSGTNVTALPATFGATGTSVKVGAVAQTSGTTPNNFTTPVTYTVTAADASTATYAVTVAVSSATAKAIASYSFAGYPGVAGTIDEAAKTIAVTLPNGSDVTALAANFTTTGNSVKVGAVAQTSGTTSNNFTAPVAYIVTAADGSTATYAVTVTVGAASAKAITAYSIAGFPAVAGTINEAAKTIAVTVPFGTNVTALVAAFTTTGENVKVGATVQTSTATANNFTAPVAYIVTAADASTATYTVTVTVAANTAKAITAYSFAGFAGATGAVNEAAKTIAVTVPFGTDVTTLAATFATTGANVKVGGAVQVSTTTTNNFTAPVAYVVTAADASTATYAVTVTVAANTAKAITAYSFAGFAGATGVINEAAKTIAVTVPNGTNLTALAATFTTTGANLKVGATVQTNTATTNNFTAPVTYRVTAADATFVDYVVTVTVAAPVVVLPGVAGTTGAAATNPTVISSNPSNGDTNVPTRTHNGTTNVVSVKVVTATFSEPMNPATITPLGVFTLKETTSGNDVPGVVTMNAANTIATFTPNVAALTANTNYTATISTAAKNAGSITAMPNPVAWSFTTMNTSFANQASPFVGQAPVDLLSAGDFSILAKTTITDVPASAITGNIGLSPGTGFAVKVTCAEMKLGGQIYTVDAGYVGADMTCVKPGPGANKTLVDNAVADMGTAYAEAAARTLPDATELGAGNISGLTFFPGLYKWSTAVNINTDITLDAKGDTNAVWIFQIAQDLAVAAKGDVTTGVKVTLTNGAKASNIFWQVGAAGVPGAGATLGTFSTFNGTILSAKQAIANTGAVLNGRLFADTQVTLQQNPVTKPAP
jgi:hypothetical protein